MYIINFTYAINLRFHKVCEDVGAEDHTIDYWRLIGSSKTVRENERKKKVYSSQLEIEFELKPIWSLWKAAVAAACFTKFSRRIA